MAKITVDLSSELGEYGFDIAQMPEGVYPFTINEPATVHASKKDGSENSMKIVLTVSEGQYKGQTQWYFRGRKLDTPEARKGLRTDLICCGVDPTKLTSQSPYDEENTWKGKQGHFYFRPKAEGEDYNILKLIHPKELKNIQARYSAGATAGGAQKSASSANGTTAKVQPTVGVPQPVVSGDISDL